MEYALFARPIVTIYEVPCETKEKDGVLFSAIADEGLYGTACKILAVGGGDNAELPEGWAEIVTFYGYHGFAHAEELAFASEGKMRSWLGCSAVQLGRTTDVMSQPNVASLRLATLERGDRVQRLPARKPGEADTGSPVRPEGWARVRLLEGREGSVRGVALEPQRYSMASIFYLEEGRPFMEAEAKGRGLVPERLVSETLNTWFGGLEDAFRISVCQTARQYLGTQYRWGGKTTRGLDCSGLVSMAYLQNGVLIYRDAKILDGWPVHEIAREAMKPGDLLYFPGHIALYLGGGKYIHSTGAVTSGGVVVNSLDPKDARYRADLAENITAVGSIF